ncbi:hypothetical protein CRG98_001220 [Punica granatum]|uniref:G-patch domain-containing protein n=1 Tax=Punica granatum TaxID=22663 RepID=A0A2I0LCJ7_PUNGR|nr:hypothetical protein CRG98_001220 [Punica granatum]
MKFGCAQRLHQLPLLPTSPRLHSININRFITRLHWSRRQWPHNRSTTTTHPRRVRPGPLCRELLHRRSRTPLRKVHTGPAGSTHLCLPLFLTYIDNSLRAIRFDRYPQARILTRPFKINPNAAGIIKARWPSSGPSINMITVCTSGRDEDAQENPFPFVIDYTPEEPTVGFAGHMVSPAPFVVDIPAREPYSDNKVPWTYEGSIGSVEQQFSVMGMTRSGRVYENPAARDKGKAPTTEVIKASEYKVVEQMAKSPAHISLLALLLSSEPHREALLRVLTAAQVPKETPPDRIEETVGSIFSSTISFSDDELPSEGWSHSRALHIVCKCNNYIIGRVMIDNGSALNVCPVTTLKQMNVDLNRRNNYIPDTGLGALGQGISRPIEIEEYKHRRGLGFRPSYHEIIEARRGHHLHRLAAHYGRLNRGIPIPPLSRFFPGPSHTIGATLDGPSSDSDDTPAAPSAVYAVIEEIPSGVHIRLAQENEELDNWTSVLRYSAVIADVTLNFLRRFSRISRLHSNPNHRHFESNPFQEHLDEPQPVYFGEGLPEDSQVSEIEESLCHLEDHQITSVEQTEEINVGTEEEPRTLKIGTALDPAQRAWMIDFLREYQEVFAWSYADMPGLDPSIVEHFLPLDTEKFPPKSQQLRRQRASLLLRIKAEVVKQINAGFLKVCNYSEWVANIVPVEKNASRSKCSTSRTRLAYYSGGLGSTRPAPSPLLYTKG